MLRFLYRCVLHAHPSYFRQRFADEMMSIFDHTEGMFCASRLFIDGVISLFRQWVLRPEFWEEPVTPAVADAAPLFYTFEKTKLRTAALLCGVLLSLMVLDGICWTMGYAWNHPVFMDIRPGYGPGGRVPEGQLIVPPVPHTRVAAEPPLYTDQGRVLLIFKSPIHPKTTTTGPQNDIDLPQAAPSLPSGDLHTPGTTAPVLDLPLSMLQSYAGTYASESAATPKVVITLDKSRLTLDISGEFRRPLVPICEAIFVAVDMPNCVVEFARNSIGTVDQVEIYRDGRHFTVFRR